MLSKERLDLIRQIVKSEKEVLVSDLSIKFDVTEETIRRDFEKLKAEGLITRTYGGAVLNTEKSTDAVHYFKRARINVEAKKYMASKALDCIKNCYIIGFDSSTTTMEFMRLIQDREDITIVTNSANALNELAQSSLKLLSTGGYLNKKSLSMQGPVAENTARNYNYDAVVISCRGISKEKGISDSDEMEVEMKKLLIEHAGLVVVIADHTKFNKISFVKIAGLDSIDYLVTDQEPDTEWMALLHENGIKVVY